MENVRSEFREALKGQPEPFMSTIISLEDGNTRECVIPLAQPADITDENTQKRTHSVYLVGIPSFTTSKGFLDFVVQRQFVSNVQELSVPDDVDALHDGCFQGTRLSKITFGCCSSLKSIGAYALSGTKIEILNVPDNVTVLGSHCCYQCQNLFRVTFGPSSSLKSISSMAFSGWQKGPVNSACPIVEIYLPDSLEELGSRCFFHCQKLTSVRFSETSSLRTIGPECFAHTALFDFTIPSQVTFVAGSAFNACSPMEMIQTCRNSHFTQHGRLFMDKSGAFCFSALGESSEVFLPDNLKELANGCFFRCSSLRFVVFGEMSLLERMGTRAMSMTSIREIVIPSSVREIGCRCFWGCKSLFCVKFSDPSSLERIGSMAFGNTMLPTIALPGSVKEIGSMCFLGCSALFRVWLGSSVEYIGPRWLEKTHVRQLTLPDSLEEIGDDCFSGSHVLAVNFGPNPGVKRIGVAAFSRDVNERPSLSRITVPDSVRELGDRCFDGYQSLVSIAFGENSSLERIGVRAFHGTSLGSIEIPKTCRVLCEEAFLECPLLVNVGLSADSLLERIGYQCFASSQLVHFIIPPSLTEIGGGIFCMCRSVVVFCHEGGSFSVKNNLLLNKSQTVCYSPIGITPCVTIPDTVREICDMCFYKCGYDLSVTFGASSSLERIGVNAFCQSGIKSIQIPDSVHTLCDKAFFGCDSLSVVRFGHASSLEHIGDQCFSATRLQRMQIPASVTSMGRAFTGLSGIVDLCCDGNSSLCVANSTLLLNTSQTVCFGVLGRVCVLSIPDSVRVLNCRCFAGCRSLAHVGFSESSSLEEIGIEAFSDTAVEVIEIPDGVRVLGDRAFFGCASLSSVRFGNSWSLECIGERCFSLSGLSKFVMPKSVSNVGCGAFSMCNGKLVGMCIEHPHFCVQNSLLLNFSGTVCYGMVGKQTKIVFPDSVRELCDRAFYKCSCLSRVSFGSSPSLERIGVAAFSKSSLRTFSIPRSVRELGDECFCDCSSLWDVELGQDSSLEHVGRDAFRGTSVDPAEVRRLEK